MDQAMTIIVDSSYAADSHANGWIIAILPPIVYVLAGAVLVVIVGLLAHSYDELSEDVLVRLSSDGRNRVGMGRCFLAGMRGISALDVGC